MPDTPLNPDALAEAIETIGLLNMAVVDPAIIGKLAIETYLAVAQPVVNSVEELDALSHETVIRDSEGFVFERIVHHDKEPEWWSTTDFLNETKVTLPARVLYRPEVKP